MQLAPPAPIIVLPPTPGIIVPPGQPGYRATPTGILLPTVTTPRLGEIVAVRETDLERIPQIVAARHGELSATYGAAAADALVGAQLQTAKEVNAQIQHDRLVAAFARGDLEAAAAASAAMARQR